MNALTEGSWRLAPDHLREIVEKARAAHAQTGQPFIACLEAASGLAAERFVGALGDATGLPVMTMQMLQRAQPAFDLMSYADAMQRECVLVRDAAGALWLAVTDPLDLDLRAWGEEKVSEPFAWCLAHRPDIVAFLATHEQNMRAMDAMLVGKDEDDGARAASEDLSIKSISEDQSTVIRLVNSTLYDAVKSGASDIHLETAPAAMTIKYRLDGVLVLVATIKGADLAEQIISRIKVMSELDIAERRVPQDGRFKVSLRGREIDVRVSVMPSIVGEDAVLRILDKQSLADHVGALRLDNLGFDAATLVSLRRLSREPYGMMLVTGPTGSGKTTSLYAALTEINEGRDKIITIEDPVEYQLPGVLQIPVNEKKGLTFARGLRSILRHDPDTILVGEIRDGETAQIAVQAALTGHLVFTTVHANNVFDVIGRFLHMEVDAYSFVSALNGVVAQRLVRLNCSACSEPVRPDGELLRESNLSGNEIERFDFRAGRGCGQCRGSGYRGRSAIAETLTLNDELRELIVARAPVSRIKAVAQSTGTRFLREAALDLVRAGTTSLEEINRVTFVA